MLLKAATQRTGFSSLNRVSVLVLEGIGIEQ